MYEIDPARLELVQKFRDNPDGPHSPELALVVNRLRLMPMADRHRLFGHGEGVAVQETANHILR